MLVGSGLTVAVVAPAALASTFITSIVGAATYAVLAINASGSIAPRWGVGLACGLGGLVGGYLGARLQPHLPERRLRLLLGALAIALAVVYLVEAVRTDGVRRRRQAAGGSDRLLPVQRRVMTDSR